MPKRTLDVSDTFSSPSEPVVKADLTSLAVFANDAAFESDKGSAGADGDIYFSTDDGAIRFNSGGTWFQNESELNKTDTVDPAVGDDSDDGFQVGSMWFNTTSDIAFIALDVTVGAAVWQQLVDVSSSQILTGKDIDGGTASDTSRITLPKDTTANLDLLTDKEGTLAYDTTLSEPVYNDGAGWNQFSGGGGASIPAGVYFPYGGSSAPTGYLLCDGAAVSRVTYADLFAAIGTAYGAGDLSTTFNVPDMRGRVPGGLDDMGGGSASRLSGTSMSPDADTIGANGGTETHTLTESEMPAHTHDINTFNNGGSNTGVGANDLASGGGVNTAGAAKTTGGGGAHLNVQPTLLSNYIIKT